MEVCKPMHGAPKSLYRWHQELKLTYLGILFTLVATAGFLWVMYGIAYGAPDAVRLRSYIELLVFVGFVGFLIYGNTLYQFARIAYIKRVLAHQRATDDELREIHGREAPRLTFLIPSYREEVRVIRQALLSAGLQEYPYREVILLIDDPPNPQTAAESESLRQARELPHKIQSLFDDVQEKYSRALRDFLSRKAAGPLNLQAEYQQLAYSYRTVAHWFETQAVTEQVQDHTDRLFVETIFAARARRYRGLATELEALGAMSPTSDSGAQKRVEQEYGRLASLFAVRLASFERKRYQNISHEPNKAMNLNSYISLMGKRFREVQRADGLYLEEMVTPTTAPTTLQVPDSAYLITLDADSLLLPEYALRLLHLLETPAFARVAVIQTPYSAVPNPTSALERIAGATTDIQYFVHQGSTYYGATFWVGANAVLRKAALEDIATTYDSKGYQIRKYIQDRTLIEDTDSSVDLIRRGWRLYNYPERLSYSATPADFGALLIQRGRWANGGLLVVPRLLGYFLSGRHSLSTWVETLFRGYYLASLAGISLCYLVILSWPYTNELNTWWLPLTAAPYYFVYARDLEVAGYCKRDVFRVYALNLLLIPVHFVGALKSLYQAISGKKSAFRRTPKVLDRTAAAPQYILFEFGLLAWLMTGTAMDFSHHHWMDGTFSLLNAIGLVYALCRFIGVRACIADLASGWTVSALTSARIPSKGSSRSHTSQDIKMGTVTMKVTALILLIPVTLVILSAACAPVAKEPAEQDPLAITTPLEPLELAITIDDLPAHGDVPPGVSRVDIAKRIILALQTNQVPEAYGFANGVSDVESPGGMTVLQAWTNAGYPLGNHTFNHPDLSQTDANAFIAEIEKMDRLLTSLVPAKSEMKLFRYPYLNEGETLTKRDQVRDYLKKTGYQIAQVTIDYGDWAWTDAYTRCLTRHDERMLSWLHTQVVSAAQRHLRRSQKLAKLVVGRDIKHILLLHVSAFNASSLPSVLKALKADGVRFVDLKTAMSDAVYQINPNLPMPDGGRTFLEQLANMKSIEDPFDEEVYSVEKLEKVCAGS